MEKRIRKMLNISITVLFLMPLILRLVDGYFRTSISDYAYSQYSQIFVSLITFAGVMFIVDGMNQDIYTRNKWYSIIIGFSLIGVGMTPHRDYPIIHYFCAGVFFLWSTIVMILFSSPKQRPYKIMAGFVTIFIILGHFFFDKYSLLTAEWIGMVSICANVLGENNNKID